MFSTVKSPRLASMTLALVAIAALVSSHLGNPTLQTVISGVQKRARTRQLAQVTSARECAAWSTLSASEHRTRPA